MQDTTREGTVPNEKQRIHVDRVLCKAFEPKKNEVISIREGRSELFHSLLPAVVEAPTSASEAAETTPSAPPRLREVWLPHGVKRGEVVRVGLSWEARARPPLRPRHAPHITWEHWVVSAILRAKVWPSSGASLMPAVARLEDEAAGPHEVAAAGQAATPTRDQVAPAVTVAWCRRAACRNVRRRLKPGKDRSRWRHERSLLYPAWRRSHGRNGRQHRAGDGLPQRCCGPCNAHHGRLALLDASGQNVCRGAKRALIICRRRRGCHHQQAIANGEKVHLNPLVCVGARQPQRQ
jgi:hypothetical protein